MSGPNPFISSRAIPFLHLPNFSLLATIATKFCLFLLAWVRCQCTGILLRKASLNNLMARTKHGIERNLEHFQNTWGSGKRRRRLGVDFTESRALFVVAADISCLGRGPLDQGGKLQRGEGQASSSVGDEQYGQHTHPTTALL